MNRDNLRLYVDRWKAVEEVNRQEGMNETMEDRWRKLNAIHGLGLALGLVRESESEKEVWKRWNILRGLR